MIKYIFFDVAGTLLGKPSLYSNIQKSLQSFSYDIDISEIEFKHKLLSEVIHFPDRTDEKFYKNFNSELLYLLGIIPNNDLLNEIFKNCTYLPWQKFDDTNILNQLNLPLGVISNFNTTLKEKLNNFFGPIFTDFFISEEIGFSKPDLEFYKIALSKIPYLNSEILYIGDSIKLDLEPAVKLGMNVLIIDRNNTYKNLKNKISSLTEITKHIG